MKNAKKLMLTTLAMVVCTAASTLMSIPAQAKEDAKEHAKEHPQDIVDTAVASGKFKTLVAAVQSAGLVETLKGKGPFTVFAPSDEAFAKLPAGTVEALLKDKEKLTAILTYHVVASKEMAAAALQKTELKTVNGKSLTLKVEGGNVWVGNGKVVKTDIAASNGVIHVIDTVLLP